MASEGASWGGEEYEVAQDVEGQHSDEQVDNFAQDALVSGDAADNGTEDGGDYDPESVTIGTPPQVPEQVASSTLSQRQPSKPKMSGGFLVEASDDEEEEGEDADESTTITNNNAQIEQPEVQTQAQTALATAMPETHSGATAIPTPDLPSKAPLAVPSLDPVTLLEARVKEDPRGDMDAWLNLIADHRLRSQVDEVRSVYNRFLEVFPQAVCLILLATVYPRILTILPGRCLGRMD